MTAKYAINSSAPVTYIDARNKAVQGFVVYFTMLDYGESHEVRVASLNASLVEKAITALIKDRDSLANLGENAGK